MYSVKEGSYCKETGGELLALKAQLDDSAITVSDVLRTLRVDFLKRVTEAADLWDLQDFDPPHDEEWDTEDEDEDVDEEDQSWGSVWDWEDYFKHQSRLARREVEAQFEELYENQVEGSVSLTLRKSGAVPKFYSLENRLTAYLNEIVLST